MECWGGNRYGQTDAPRVGFHEVNAGAYHSCGLAESGAMECWGDNRYGQSDAPNGRFRTASAGGVHSCGLRENGAVECWGYTFDGQAQPPAGRHVAVSAGEYHACALSEAGTVSCWMIYNGVSDVPAWLRPPSGAMPTTGTGGLLRSSWSAQDVALAALGLAGATALVVLATLLRRRWVDSCVLRNDGG